ncbi:hypothetical protein J3E72DRAFT_409151 [Bipolaris maydis]|nr:hypothetical protein J3E72DRAFT_409151 [Bipolaris maydis]
MQYPGFLLQLKLPQISQENLLEEFKSTYSRLAMVENKCIHVDRAKTAAIQDPDTKLSPDQWQELIALHRTLLNEHCEFFRYCRHPSASPALRHLAAKYSMPARMWIHGIHSLLELFRPRLSDNMDSIRDFICLAYQKMAFLYESVPAFEDIWMECLGDLGRWRKAIEYEDVRDHDTWADVARSWYTKVADKNPIVGRLYHHLAILARPNALQQIYYFSRSLTSAEPFKDARASIRTLLDPVVDPNTASLPHALPIDISFIKLHGLQFLGRSVKDDRASEEFLMAKTEFLDSLDNYIGQVTAKRKDRGVWVAVTNIAGWFDYGVDDNALRQAFLMEFSERAKNPPSTAPEEKSRTASAIEQRDPIKPSVTLSQIQEKLEQLAAQQTFKNAQLLSNATFALALRRLGDKNVLLHINIMLSFLTSLSSFSSCAYIFDLIKDTPWSDLVTFLNKLLETESQSHSQTNTSNSENINTLLSTALFPADDERPDELPLPEDYLTRGLIWAHGYFPENWFAKERDEEERYLESASTTRNRISRVLRLGYAIAKQNRWISYDASTRSFSVITSAP